MLLKAILLAVSLLAGGLGTLQASVLTENYLLLGLGLVLTLVGVLRLTDQRRTAA